MSIPSPDELVWRAGALNTEQDVSARRREAEHRHMVDETRAKIATVRGFLRPYVETLEGMDAVAYPIYQHTRVDSQPVAGYWRKSHAPGGGQPRAREQLNVYHTYTPAGKGYLLRHTKEWDYAYDQENTSGLMVSDKLDIYDDVYLPIRADVHHGVHMGRTSLTAYFIEHAHSSPHQFADTIEQMVVEGIAAHQRGDWPLPVWEHADCPPIFSSGRVNASNRSGVRLDSYIVDDFE
jgi:hypothetical protein